MKKSLLAILLCVFGDGCAPELTREEKLAIGFAQHPEWSERDKQLMEGRNIDIGMTPEQVELAWDMHLRLEYADSSDRVHYEGRNCTSRWSQDLVTNGKYEYKNWGLLAGTYSFCFRDGRLEDWSWSPECYNDY